MILAAHQPNYLPWLGFFHKIALGDLFVLVPTVQFSRQSATHHTKIKTRGGRHQLTLPVQAKKDQFIMEVLLAHKHLKKHWHTLHHAYGKSPSYESPAANSKPSTPARKLAFSASTSHSLSSWWGGLAWPHATGRYPLLQ